MEIRNLDIQNQCYMMKWLWRFASSEQALWRAIRNQWPKLRGNCNIKLGNGRRTSFWEDKWLEQGSLKTLFLDIFWLNQQIRATVAEIWSSQGWNLSFRRYKWLETRGWWSFTRSWGSSKELLMHKIVWDDRITIKTISVSKEPTRSFILVTVRAMGGHGSWYEEKYSSEA